MNDLEYTKKLKNRSAEMDRMIDSALTAAKIHLRTLLKKASDEELNYNEAYVLCSYIKSFSSLEKLTKDEQKEYAKAVSKMTDAEINQALKEHSAELIKLADYEDEDDE